MNNKQQWLALGATIIVIASIVILGNQVRAAGGSVYLPFVTVNVATKPTVVLPYATSVPPTNAPTEATVSPTATSAPVVVPAEDAASARLTVPAGFAVRLFATGLQGPRLMTVGPDGMLYVAEPGSGQITRLPDRNNDGLADGKEVVASGLSAPQNMEWHAGALYVAESDKITKLADGNNDGDFLDKNEKTTITSDIPTGGGHSSRTLHFGPDGKLYVAAGSSCNICAETDKRRATIMRFNPDGTIPSDNPFVNDPDPNRHAVWAEGLRNSVDFLFTSDGQLWADHNGRDQMINDTVKNNKPLEEAIIPVQGGKNHGWPYCTSEHTDGSAEPGPGPYAEVADPSSDVPVAPAGFSCANAVAALFTVTPHSAPLGMTLYNGTGFPTDYQGDVFMALHGSWNRTPPAACRVVRISVEAGKPVSSDDMLSGFQDNANQTCASAWGRPAGVAVGADGALYVSDDSNGNVYRIVYTGAS